MLKIIQRLFCRHDHTVHDHTDLVRQEDGSFKTKHYWRCKSCGKVISGK